ncbi:DUF3969 family protein [Pseudomonas serbica]
MFQIKNYSDEQLAFVITCLFHESIDTPEFKDWCVKISESKDAPSFIYDLMAFDGPLFKIHQSIGYVPYWEHTKDDEYALYGIAVLRGTHPYDMPISSSEALKSLKKSSEIMDLFSKVFDFIKL